MIQELVGNAGEKTSYGESLTRWTTRHAASGYPSHYGRSLRDRLEHRCIRQFVESLTPGSRILDLPCGTGRLTPLLQSRGLRVVGADCSEWMVQAARETWTRGEAFVDSPAGAPTFEVRQAMRTGYPEGAFDAVICNRLFHHFREASTREAVLRELGRICRGPIMVSFFNSFALDAVRLKIRHRLRGVVPTDRIPIPLSAMLQDVRNASLEVLETRAVMWGLSPMWYVVMQNRTEAISRAG